MNYGQRFVTGNRKSRPCTGNPCTGNRDQDHPQGKEMKKAKWLSEEALQITAKRREAQSKGERKDIPI